MMHIWVPLLAYFRAAKHAGAGMVHTEDDESLRMEFVLENAYKVLHFNGLNTAQLYCRVWQPIEKFVAKFAT